ncbi:uncharacterized protein BDZ99DRAFT_514180 [Mytilinidion resinicola]|uniref:Uncharacterized protein n=1 Tax=Mytilinidion resinicola TaxID=574789 RepID=A0A6A6ZAT9_9PEZI|nr:uncharacterized protein BDZ99DRAFT_514180 [Mytilinidion resinicola]KAF2817958.1 hypothetical protein BDZ99DRAFT_514180 [Mytilinidion resinicola]
MSVRGQLGRKFRLEQIRAYASGVVRLKPAKELGHSSSIFLKSSSFSFSYIWTSNTLVEKIRWRPSDEYYTKARKFETQVLSTFEVRGLSPLARDTFCKRNTFDYSSPKRFHLFLQATTKLASGEELEANNTFIRRVVVWLKPSDVPLIRHCWHDLSTYRNLKSLVFVSKSSFPYFSVPHNRLQGNIFLEALADLARARYAEGAMRLQDHLLVYCEEFLRRPGRVQNPEKVLRFSLNEEDMFLRLDLEEFKTSRTIQSLRDQISDVYERFEHGMMELLWR